MKALIYCRVSSERQVTDGNGLTSQEQRCRQYAENKKYVVDKVFADEGISGGLFDRPEMFQLIEYLDEHIDEQFVIIFDDLARFARDLKVHLKLKTELVSRGATLESPNFQFEDSPEGEFIENVLASKAQLDRHQNRRQVIQKMKARAESGYWPFCLPPGLKNQRHPLHGKIATPDEPIASVFKSAIEGYRDRILLTQFDVVAFIQNQYKLLNMNRKISLHGVQRLLTEILYTGYIEYPHWNITRRKGVHEGFITLETYDEVQRILNDRTKPKIRRDTNPEFPLRGLILCPSCLKPYTASFNTSRNGQRYPNYFCKTRGCSLQNKIAHREDVENNFMTLLQETKLSKEIANLAYAVLTDVWNKQQNTNVEAQQAQKRISRELNDGIENMTKLIQKTNNDKLIRIYESKLLELDEKKNNMDSITTLPKFTEEQFGTATKKVMSVLENPATMWQNGDLNDRLTVFFMHFDRKPVYDRKTGFGTATLGQSVNIIRSLGSEKIHSVETESIELSSKNESQTHLQA
jgi:site-specific DNA recombinase